MFSWQHHTQIATKIVQDDSSQMQIDNEHDEAICTFLIYLKQIKTEKSVCNNLCSDSIMLFVQDCE